MKEKKRKQAGGQKPAAQPAATKWFNVTPTTSKHRTFIWLEHPILPDHKLAILAFEDDYYFGVLHSHIHEVWALRLGTRLETRPNYTPTTCFETFPFPRPTPAQEAAIAAAAKELNELRERWLNPPEWTRTEFLEFPASVAGPWARYTVGPLPSAGVGPSAASGARGLVRLRR